MTHGRIASLLLRAALPLALLAVWTWAAEAGFFPAILLPSPAAVARRAASMIASGELFEHAATSLARVAAGFALSSAAALVFAFLFYRRRGLEAFFSMPLEALRVVPPLALVPLLILWLGIDEAPKLAIVILSSFFPVHLGALVALREVEARYRELGAALGLSDAQMLRHIHAPGAAPGIFTGLRIGFGYAWRALVGAELIAAASGLGYLIEDASALARTDVILVGILTIAVLGITCDAILSRAAARLLERRPRSAKHAASERATAAAAPAGVTLDAVSFAYAAGAAPVRGFSMRLQPGRVTALLGRSGCGKTTVMKLAAGLLSPSSGAVRRESRDAGSESRTGIVFQQPMLLPWKSVAENVELGLLALEMTAAERAAAVAEALRAVGLTDASEHFPDALSGGMAQRAGVARALARNPSILFLDEPFGALDALTRTELQCECLKLVESRPLTVLLITHDVREAVRLADEVLVMKEGRVAQRFESSAPHPRSPVETPESLALEERILEAVLERREGR